LGIALNNLENETSKVRFLH